MSDNLIGYLLTTVLVLAGIMFGVVMYESAQSSSNQTTGSMQLATVIANTKSLYAGQPNYTGLDTASAVQGGVFPADMATAGTTTATDIWGGAVHDDAAATGFTVTLDGVPDADCTHVATSYSGADLLSLAINGASLTPPITPPEAAADCTVAGVGATGGNALAFSIN